VGFLFQEAQIMRHGKNLSDDYEATTDQSRMLEMRTERGSLMQNKID
jgi:hypothetical protein